MLRRSLILTATTLLLVVLFGTAFRFGWLGQLTTKTHASAKAIAAVSSSAAAKLDQTALIEKQWIVFTPKATVSTPTIGLIFYPCALCDARGFAPLTRQIAEAGFLTALIPMPSNFAIFDYERALEVQAHYPSIQQWVVGGHSMGGGASAMFLAKHPTGADGLLMWDSYTNADYDISTLGLPVLSLYGNRHHDPKRKQTFTAAKPYLPATTRYQVIDGSDHFQFGDFAPEDVAHRSFGTLPLEEQHRQLLAYSIDFLNSFSVPAKAIQ
ncbi:alpha/beta hydrolase [Oceanicoccus sp. KOV_DT_Chl]|uniref:alpha/beta hydrolase n=1 Tax=Oceanicoccus sp. KOV_DT_Chl TaxID=1904639 RepID=UPI000C79C4D4|nr:alpha/beta hydrolase [Oceanicoccus sp. KOV_DT_Chl]